MAKKKEKGKKLKNKNEKGKAEWYRPQFLTHLSVRIVQRV
jgi:hypothetical protein